MRIQKVLSDKAFFLFFLFERIEITRKVGNQRPSSKTPFKWRIAGGLNGVSVAVNDAQTLNTALVAL